jgi:hypothetical protein
LWDEIKYELADKLGEQLSQLKIAELFFWLFSQNWQSCSALGSEKYRPVELSELNEIKCSEVE